MSVRETWQNSMREAQMCLDSFLADKVQVGACENFSNLLADLFRKDGKLFICGNGGSHCDAMHFAEELTGRYRKDRKSLGALALGDASHITCVANDYGFEQIYARQLSALARRGDLLVVLSTSGNSPNILRALEVAKVMGITTVGLLGRGGGKALALCDLAVVVPGSTSDRIQELHMKIYHTAIESVERELFPENY